MINILVAAALGVASASGANIAAPQTKPSADEPKKQREQTYCLQYERATGSRVEQTECKTKQQWRAAGVDIDELMRKPA